MSQGQPLTGSYAPIGPNRIKPTAHATFPIGTPLTALFEKAGAGTSPYTIGLAATPGHSDSPVQVIGAGPLTLTLTQWQAITEDGTGLQAGSAYYLSYTAIICHIRPAKSLPAPA